MSDDKDILWFDVSMHYAARMNILDSLKNLVHYKRNLFFWKHIPLWVIEEITSTYLFHNDEDFIFGLKSFLNLDHIRMKNLLKNGDFFSKNHAFLWFQIVYCDYFHCLNFACISICALAHFWELTSANLAAHSISFLERLIFCLDHQNIEPLV